MSKPIIQNYKILSPQDDNRPLSSSASIINFNNVTIYDDFALITKSIQTIYPNTKVELPDNIIPDSVECFDISDSKSPHHCTAKMEKANNPPEEEGTNITITTKNGTKFSGKLTIKNNVKYVKTNDSMVLINNPNSIEYNANWNNSNLILPDVSNNYLITYLISDLTYKMVYTLIVNKNSKITYFVGHIRLDNTTGKDVNASSVKVITGGTNRLHREKRGENSVYERSMAPRAQMIAAAPSLSSGDKIIGDNHVYDMGKMIITKKINYELFTLKDDDMISSKIYIIEPNNTENDPVNVGYRINSGDMYIPKGLFNVYQEDNKTNNLFDSFLGSDYLKHGNIGDFDVMLGVSGTIKCKSVIEIEEINNDNNDITIDRDTTNININDLSAIKDKTIITRRQISFEIKNNNSSNSNNLFIIRQYIGEDTLISSIPDITQRKNGYLEWHNYLDMSKSDITSFTGIIEFIIKS